MKILNRRQTTDVVVRRTVSHELEHEGEVYIRYCNVTTTVPYMDHAVKVLSEKIKWQKYINTNQVTYLTKREVKDLNLEALYGQQPLKDKNGNVIDYYDQVHNI